jgi:hypothetical protein
MEGDKFVAGSFLYNFYIDMQQLNNSAANYISLINYLKLKYGDIDGAAYTDSEKAGVENLYNNLRYFCNKCYINYLSYTEENERLKLLEAYDKVNNRLVPVVEDVVKFVVEINRFILTPSLQELMKTSVSLVSQIYKDDRTTKEPADTQV